MKYDGGSLLRENDTQRDSAKPHGGSIENTMNQGGTRSHESDHTIPQLMNQGGSDKRGSKTHATVASLLGQ